jgi:hypothetical protein
MKNTAKTLSPSNTYYECGICGFIHPVEFDGDCRDDSSRFALDEIPSDSELLDHAPELSSEQVEFREKYGPPGLFR